MKNYHKNPRTITTKQFTELKEWLRELGDLSGIVHDLNSDEIIGGNQRGRVFDINSCKITMLEEYPQPDEQGTVGWGFIIWEGKKYAYRQVRWTEKQCEKANIIANKSGGGWDFDTLANQWNIDDLLQWGFNGYELGIPGGIDPNEEWKGMPEFDHQDLSAFRSIIIHFKSAQDVIDFGELINQSISNNAKYLWFPPRERENLKSMVFQNES